MEAPYVVLPQRTFSREAAVIHRLTRPTTSINIFLSSLGAVFAII